VREADEQPLRADLGRAADREATEAPGCPHGFGDRLGQGVEGVVRRGSGAWRASRRSPSRRPGRAPGRHPREAMPSARNPRRSTARSPRRPEAQSDGRNPGRGPPVSPSVVGKNSPQRKFRPQRGKCAEDI
jgi:hypothetical protein